MEFTFGKHECIYCGLEYILKRVDGDTKRSASASADAEPVTVYIDWYTGNCLVSTCPKCNHKNTHLLT